MKILVLLSGGLDSAVVLASLCKEHECSALGFYYCQPHYIELNRASQIAEYYGVPYNRKDLPPMPRIDGVIVAGRNLVFAASALAEAQAKSFDAIAVGCSMSDWHYFPDCRPVFWAAIRSAAEAYGVKVLTPLLHTLKQDIVIWAHKNSVPIDLTWSCYSPQTNMDPCGICLACKTRKEAMEWLP